MMSANIIEIVSNSDNSNRANEQLQNIWAFNNDACNIVSKIGEFSFTCPTNPISEKISTLIDNSRENVYISTSNLTDSNILSSIESAISRNIRIYLLIDSSGFKSFLDYEGSAGVKGHILTRERKNRGLDIVLSDWKLASKKGFLLNNPLDGTLSKENGNWCMELDENQVDALRNHSEHEFWSSVQGQELLSPDTEPEVINSRPYTLKTLTNNDFVLREACSLDGNDNNAEKALRNETNWNYFSGGKSLQNSIILSGEEVVLGKNADKILVSSPRSNLSNSKIAAHSGFSILVAMGESSYLAGWDRDAKGDWYSLILLNSKQENTVKSLIGKYTESPEWIGHSKIKLGEAGNRIIRNGTEMEISDSQTQDLGVIHLDKMPDSSEVLQSHKPELIPPSDSLARQCEFKWISAPPVPSKSASEDQLHDDWDNARDEISARLNSLDKLNVVSKLPGFGRKAKELQKSIVEAIEKSDTINDPKSLTDLVDEVEKLTKSVGGNLDAIKAAEEETERKMENNKQLEEYKSKVSKAKEVIEKLSPKLIKVLNEREALKQQLSKANEVEKLRIEADIQTKFEQHKQYQTEIKSAKAIAESDFEVTPVSKAIKPNKNENKGHKFLGDTRESKIEVKVPKEGLPTFGTLFKDGNIRYLAVSDWDHVEQGRKDAKRLNATLCASREVLK